MKSLSVLELSKLYNINRQTIYNHINKGILSKNSDNKIDLSEAIRVFGEPIKKQDVKESVKIDIQNSAEVLLLRQQIDMLKNQLDDAKHRESFYQNQIEAMQRLLASPKPSMTTFADQKPVQPDIEQTDPEPNTTNTLHDKLVNPEQIENEQISEPEKRGFWSRFFKPYG